MPFAYDANAIGIRCHDLLHTVLFKITSIDMRVYVCLATGFEDMEALGTLDVLRRAGVDARTVSMTGDVMVTTAHGVTVKCDELFEEADFDAAEMVVLPGGLPGATHLRRDERVCELVREFPDEDVDVLVVDPPRAGLDEKVVELVSSTSARDVAYVSCDPATLARDLRRFCDRGAFKPVSVTPVDLFPQTYHVETVTHLTRA